MAKKPIIGITLDHETKDTYAKYPWYALRENYATAVSNFGGIPLMLPHTPEAVSEYISMIDGLILTGGDFDIDPSFYGENISSDTVTMKDKRTAFEMDICKAALDLKKPILGICAGQQLLNVILGGTLIQHIPDSIENCLEHEQKTPKHEPSHAIKVEKDSLLYKITSNENYMVNSTHHQAVKDVGPGVKVNATAPDGVIEGIEYNDHPFCLGLEWHPEYCETPEDRKVFEYFVNTCKK